MFKKKKNFVPNGRYCYEVLEGFLNPKVKFCSYLSVGGKDNKLFCTKIKKEIPFYLCKVCEGK